MRNHSPASQMWLWFGQGSTSSQGSVPLTDLLNSAGLAWWFGLELKSSQEMFTGTVTHFHCDHDYKMSQGSSVGGLAVEDGESPGAWACGCNITRELEVGMPQTWLFEQVPFGCSWLSNDLCNVTSKEMYSTPSFRLHLWCKLLILCSWKFHSRTTVQLFPDVIWSEKPSEFMCN